MNRSITAIFMAIAFILSIGVVGVLPADAEVLVGEIEEQNLRFYQGFHTAGVVQSLAQSGANASDTDLEDAGSGIQHAIGNLTWRVEAGDHVEVFFDATMASRVHNEKFWGHQGYMLIKSLPEDSGLWFLNPVLNHIDIKAGHFVLDYGEAIHRRSLNADAQRNPLVGNPLVSPHTTEAGAELIYDQGPISVVAGVTNGVPTEDFSDTQYSRLNGAVHGKIKADLGTFMVSGSGYSVDHGTNAGRYTSSNLYGSERLGEKYAEVYSGWGSNGQLLLGDGFRVKSYRVDLGFDPYDGLDVYAAYGSVYDGGRNYSGGTDEWTYNNLEFVHDLGTTWWVAGRYGMASASQIDSNENADGSVSRIQFGVGTDVTEQIQFKLEGVSQSASGFDSGNSGTNDARFDNDPEFSGAMAEFSYSL